MGNIFGACPVFSIWRVLYLADSSESMTQSWAKFVKMDDGTVRSKPKAAFAAIMLTERFGRPLSANTSAASGRWPIRRTRQ